MRLVLVHGRSQQGRNAEELKRDWLAALDKGLQQNELVMPEKVDVRLPFYGDRLEEFARESKVPLTEDLRTRGGDADPNFLEFEAEIAEALRRRAGVTVQQVNEVYGDIPKPMGPQNWHWVRAIFRALDKHVPGISDRALETFTRDVYLYSTRSGVKAEINRIVAADLAEQERIVVVGHSLGSVVAYTVLREDPRSLQVPCFLTIGSPLGVRPIRDQLKPLKFPKAASTWFNAFDARDIVALHPLDLANFPVTPAVTNYSKVNNHTDNRHGIVGYLDDPTVAKTIHMALS
jgi:hypothetical protein